MALAPLWAAAQRFLIGSPGPLLPAGESLSLTFPATQLQTRVRIALSADFTADPSTWLWEDISAIRNADGTGVVRNADGITCSCGRADWASTADTKKATLRLDNTGGRFVRRNPSSPYFGKLSKNTPIWIEVNPGSGWITRFQGFVNEWPTKWADRSGRSSSVPIVCAGVLRRLSQNNAAPSAARRSITAASPDAYWPCEDGSSATVAGSAIAGGPPAGVTTGGGAASFGPSSTFPGSTGAVSFTATSTTSAGQFVPIGLPSMTAGAFTFGFAVSGTRVAATTPALWDLFVDFNGGTVRSLRFEIYSSPLDALGLGIDAKILDSSGLAFGSALSSALHIDPFDGGSHAVIVTLKQVGSDVTIAETYDGQPVTNLTTATGFTLGTPSQIRGPFPQGGFSFPNGGTGDNTGTSLALAHIAAWDSDPTSTLDFSDAVDGYDGEQAHVRLRRLCSEANLPFVYWGDDGSVLMGAQPDAPLVTLLRECETADQGFLYEDGFGIGYQGRNERENMPTSWTLDFDSHHIAEVPEPADDDQLTKNRWTVSRSGGATATAQDDDSVAADGEYDSSVDVNVHTDGQVADQAQWRAHLGAVDVDRWPSIAVNLTDPRTAATLIPTWGALRLGQRINVTNPPAEMPQTAIDAFVEGYVERWDSKRWDATLLTSPAVPYDVGTLANDTGDTSDVLGWLEYDTCDLAADVSTSDTSWTISCTPSETSTADDYPRDHFIGGERITVTASTGGTSPTWTVTRSVNGVSAAHSAGDSIELAQPVILTL